MKMKIMIIFTQRFMMQKIYINLLLLLFVPFFLKAQDHAINDFSEILKKNANAIVNYDHVFIDLINQKKL
jgi:hypothetical protein